MGGKLPTHPINSYLFRFKFLWTRLSEPKYHVVKFEDHSVGIVAYNWLRREEKVCWWPHTRSACAMMTVSCRTPDEKNGAYYPYLEIRASHGKFRDLHSMQSSSNITNFYCRF